MPDLEKELRVKRNKMRRKEVISSVIDLYFVIVVGVIFYFCYLFFNWLFDGSVTFKILFFLMASPIVILVLYCMGSRIRDFFKE